MLTGLDVKMKNKAMGNHFARDIFLKFLSETGFYGSYFFEAARNIANKNDYQMILSQAYKNNRPLSGIESGDYRIGFAESKIYECDQAVPIRQRAEEPCSEASDGLARQLEYFDLNRVHIPVYSKKLLIGAVTLTWHGAETNLTEENIHGLKLVASIIAKYWSVAVDSAVETAIKDIKDIISQNNHDDYIGLVFESAVPKIMKAVDAAACAAFEYNWYSDELKKTHEKITPPGSPDTNTSKSHLELPESYYRGEFLTGKAWQHKDIQHIVDFPNFHGTHAIDIKQDSLNYHKEKLGEVLSIIYSKIGKKGRQVLIRCMNRSSTKLPYLTMHKIVLDRVCEALSEIVDDLYHQNRIRALQDVSKLAIQSLTKPRKTFDKALKALEYECAANIGILASEPSSDSFTYCYFGDPKVDKEITPPFFYGDDSFFQRIHNTGDHEAHDLSQPPRNAAKNDILNVLLRNDYRLILTVPVEARGIKGVLIVPAPANTKGSHKALKSRIPDRHLSSLAAYGSIIMTCIEVEASFLTSEKAKRLVGQIGHEISGPVSRLGQQAISASNEAIKFARSLEAEDKSAHIDSVNAINDKKNKVARQMQRIDNLMNVAITMAQQSTGKIQVHFTKINLQDLMENVRKEINASVELIDQNGVSRPYEISFNPALSRDYNLIGDFDLLHKSFVNIIGNAVKYSLPPGGRKKSTISVKAEPQGSQLFIVVENWGIALPHQDRELIFNAFQRGSVKDPRRARRGMGLGLYIARRFLLAHAGRVRCRYSKPTFDDPTRKSREGWTTAFEVRLPFNLKEGTYDVNI